MRALFALSAAILLGGCASAAGTDTIKRGTPTTTTIQTSTGDYELETIPESRVRTHWIRTAPDSVWSALPAVYETLGVTPLTIDREAGLYGNRDVRLSRIAGERLSRFFDCGRNPIGAPVANTASVQLDILTAISPSGNGTEVTNRFDARARSRSGSSSEVQCTSTGALEELMMTRLRELTGTTSG